MQLAVLPLTCPAMMQLPTNIPCWLTAVCRKLQVVLYKLEEMTYTKDTVPALKQIERLLDEQEVQLQQEMEQVGE